MHSPFDTIVAPVTGTQRAAIAVVRVSGPQAWTIGEKVFSQWPDPVVPRQAVYGRLANGDEGLAVPFGAGHSYTGEKTVELSLHGSPASIRGVVESCIEAGARQALPGEFTQRAFLNGRMDLTQAEAVRDTVESQTEAQLRAANLIRHGALYHEVAGIRARLSDVLVAVEAATDFGEEIGELDSDWARNELSECRIACRKLLDTANSGRILREGLRIAIVGPPNSGKSSLLNALLGCDRAIVTEIPGTTRDFVEESADLGGVPCVLIDTAGLRDTADLVESIGVQRSRTQAAGADLVWYVFDAAVGWTEEDEAAAGTFDRPVTILANKCDLLTGDPKSLPLDGGGEVGVTSQHPAGEGTSGSLPLPDSSGLSRAEEQRKSRSSTAPEGDAEGSAVPQAPESPIANPQSPVPQVPESPIADRQSLYVSALTRQGLPELVHTVQSQADFVDEHPRINTRHRPLLLDADQAVAKALAAIDAELPADLLSTCLQEAIGSLGQITGETATPEMLEAIFSRFCIGK